MVRTVQDAIITALDNLGERHLKRFRNKLNDWPIKEGYSRIPRGWLEDADPDDTADLIMKFYTDSYGIEVTLAVLEAIDERKVAEELREDLRNVYSPVIPKPRKHFVIEHRAALINRVPLVSPILDDLLDKEVLNYEAYCIIRSKAIAQEQMRQLYSYVGTWGDSIMDTFYDTLGKHYPHLIRDLRASQKE